MDALKEIGIKKAMQFVFYAFYSFLLKHSVFPQIRVFLIKLAGCDIGENTIIYDVTFANLYHYGFSRLKIGNKCFIGQETMIDTRGYVVLEDSVTISNRCNIISHINVGYKDHPLQKSYPTNEGKVVIKKGAYLGTGVTVLPNVTIGEKAVIGAGAVVTKNIEKGIFAAGVPAKRIRNIKN